MVNMTELVNLLKNEKEPKGGLISPLYKQGKFIWCLLMLIMLCFD